ncbi:MAG: hypothetical protein JMJ93_02305 [Synergistaceae bacterium]|jgi:hypothetical protein|nr:hypothetical protein [Synergistaceae bacterium]
MRKKGILVLLLIAGGTFCWVLWQPPIPESGFFYSIRDGNQVWRTQKFFRSSPVRGARPQVMEGGAPTFIAWATVTATNALEGEPTGVCFFDDDGDFSGFLLLPAEGLQELESLCVEGGSFFLTFSGDREDRVFPLEEARFF